MEIVIKETLGKNVKAGEIKNWPMETIKAVAQQAGRKVEEFCKPVSDEARENFKAEGMVAKSSGKRGKAKR